VFLVRVRVRVRYLWLRLGLVLVLGSSVSVRVKGFIRVRVRVMVIWSRLQASRVRNAWVRKGTGTKCLEAVVMTHRMPRRTTTRC